MGGHWHFYVPDGLQVAQACALLAVAAGFSAIGAAARLLAGGDRALPEADLLVGWALVATLFIVAGSLTPVPFTVLAGLTALAAVAAFAILAWRRHPILPAGAGRTLVLLIPILLVTLSQIPSENDDFSQWLPNLRYLATVDHFPGPGLPISDSVFPAYPYATTIVAYLAGKLAGGLALTGVDRFNLLLLASLGLLLGRLFRGDAPARPGWAAAACGLAAVTLLSPTFVPKLVLSAYADAATSVALAFAAVLSLRAVEDERPSPALLLQIAAAFAAVLLTKQANLVLLVLLLAGVALTTRSAAGHLAPLAISLGAALLAALAWRHQVGLIGGGEMGARSFGEWQFSVLPEILESMWTVMYNKGVYFGLALVLCWLGFASLRRRDGSAPLAIVFAITFLGFTAFLLWVYLAVYIGYEGRSAASFWRYHTQLGGLLLAATATVAGHLWRRSEARRPGWLPQALKVACLVGVVAGPVVAARHLRFDIHPVKAHVRAAVADMAGILPPDATLLVADPRGSGFFNNFVRWHLGLASKAKAVGGLSAFTPAGQVAPTLAATAPSHIYLLTSTPEVEATLGLTPPPEASSLLAHTASGWAVVRSWPFQGFHAPRDVKY